MDENYKAEAQFPSTKPLTSEELKRHEHLEKSKFHLLLGLGRRWMRDQLAYL